MAFVERYIRLLSSQVKEYFTIFWSFPRAVAARALPLRLQQPIRRMLANLRGGRPRAGYSPTFSGIGRRALSGDGSDER
jgi:hypothetical protein